MLRLDEISIARAVALFGAAVLVGFDCWQLLALAFCSALACLEIQQRQLGTPKPKMVPNYGVIATLYWATLFAIAAISPRQAALAMLSNMKRMPAAAAVTNLAFGLVYGLHPLPLPQKLAGSACCALFILGRVWLMLSAVADIEGAQDDVINLSVGVHAISLCSGIVLAKLLTLPTNHQRGTPPLDADEPEPPASRQLSWTRCTQRRDLRPRLRS